MSKLFPDQLLRRLRNEIRFGPLMKRLDWPHKRRHEQLMFVCPLCQESRVGGKSCARTWRDAFRARRTSIRSTSRWRCASVTSWRRFTSWNRGYPGGRTPRRRSSDSIAATNPKNGRLPSPVLSCATSGNNLASPSPPKPSLTTNHLSYGHSKWHNRGQIKWDAATAEPVRVRVLHDNGIAEKLVGPEDDSIGDMQLETWARITGRLMQGSQPIGDQWILLFSARASRSWRGSISGLLLRPHKF